MIRPGLVRLVGAATLSLVVSGCHAILPADGGGLAEFTPPREVDPRDVLLAPGYTIEPVATGLTFPTGIAFDDQARPHVIEAGYSYGEVFAAPRLLRLQPDGSTTPVATGTGVPWTGVTFHEGAFYVAQGGGPPEDPAGEGAILRISPNGEIKTVVAGLPGRGDHHTNGPVMGADGWLYFSQGTATNSGVVGLDNYEMGWPKRDPLYHDIPCKDVVLSGTNYSTANPFSPEVAEPFGDDPETVTTGAFVPFGVATQPGQVIEGRIPCSGAVMRVRPKGGPIELVAWGFRNPFGMGFAPDGHLYVTENSYDERGSRPVFGAGDLMWRVEPGRWYGWPEFHNRERLNEEYRAYSDKPESVQPLLAELPSVPPKAAALFGVHASANGFDFSRSSNFGYAGQAFVSQFGDMVPVVGKTLVPVGFKVVTVDPKTGVIHDFAANVGDTHGPASWAGHGGLERPIDAQFTPDGRTLYIVDFGVMTVRESGMQPVPGTGVVWRITREEPPR